MQPKRDRLYFPFGECLLMVIHVTEVGRGRLKAKGFSWLFPFTPRHSIVADSVAKSGRADLKD